MYYFFWFLLGNSIQASCPLYQVHRCEGWKKPQNTEQTSWEKQEVLEIPWSGEHWMTKPTACKMLNSRDSCCTTLSQSLSSAHWAPMATGLPEASGAQATWVSQAELWLECSWPAAELCNKPKVKARQTLGNFPGPQSRGGISRLHRKPGCSSSYTTQCDLLQVPQQPGPWAQAAPEE